MWPTIVLVLCLMVATAVIAYWSDNLGKKLGKKRVTLFGLRPKQTATLITIGSSMPIMLFTLGATLLAYKPLRDSLTKYEATRRDRDLALQEKASAEKIVGLKQAQLVGLQSDVTSAQEDKDKALRERGDALSQRGKVLEELKKARADVKAEKLKAQSASRAAEQAQREVARAGRDVEQARSRARAAQAAEGTAKRSEQLAHRRERNALAAASRAQARVRTATAAYNVVDAKLAKVNAQFSKAQDDVARVTRDLDAVTRQRDAQLQQINRQGAKIIKQGGEILKKQGEIDAKQIEYERVSEAFAVAERDLKTLKGTLEEEKSSPSLMAADETLAEATVAPGQSSLQVRAQLATLIEDARLQVRRFGQKVSIPNLGMEISTLHVRYPDGSELDISPENLLRYLEDRLVGVETPSSVRVITARPHTFRDSKIEVRLSIVEVRTVFKRGDVLASGSIDGNSSDARIFRQLKTLTDAGRRAANEAGVQPPLLNIFPDDLDNVLFYARDTNERVFDALRAIKSFKGMTRVRIVAASDLSTAAPLNIRFDVEPAASSSSPSGGPST